MPSTSTITSFYEFAPITVIKSSEMNSNFQNFRGHFLPINTDTATSSNYAHDLGASDHYWRSSYVQEHYQNEIAFGSTPPANSFNSYFKSDGKKYKKNSADVERTFLDTDLVLAKGDLLVGLGANTLTALTIGSNSYVLTANSATTTGMAWKANASNPLTTKGDLFAFDTAAARLPAGTDGQVLTSDSTSSYGVKWSLPTVNKNLVLNGSMNWDQNKEGGVYSSTSTEFYSLDQWRICGAGATGVFSVQRVASSAPGFPFSLNMVVTTQQAVLAAADNFHLEYPIEGSAISGLAWGTASAKTVALSFWVYASEAGVYSVSIMEGTNSRSYVTTFTINSATTWEYKTIIIPGDTSGTYQTTNGSFGIKIIWSLGVGSTASTSTSETWQGAAYWNKTGTSQLIQKANGNNLYITGVQLEIGNISTAFQYLNQSEELLLLQRFYFKTMSKGTAVAQNAGAPGVATYIVQGPSNATGGVMINYPVKMSSSPTLTFYNPRTTNAKWRQLSNDIDSGTASSFFANESSVYIANSAGEASTSLVGIHMTANARLGGL